MKKYLLGTAVAILAVGSASSQNLGGGGYSGGNTLSPTRPRPSLGAIVPPWSSTAGIQTPAGCNFPVSSSTAHSFYVDPVVGKPTNSGTSASPWDLATALAQAWSASGGANAISNPVVSLGDTFLLNSGNYGDLQLQGYYSSQLGYDNKSQFLTIKAAPGATPVFTSIHVAGGLGGWVFHGLTIRQIAPNLPTRNYNSLVQIDGDNHDIIFDSNTIESATDVTSWTQAQWIANASWGITHNRSDVNGMKCLSITNNTIQNVGNGMQTQRGNFVLIKGNTIDHFMDDGIDYGSNNVTIQNNLLTNHVDAGNGVHSDFMQGQPYPADVNSNILIDSNIAVRQTDPNLPFAAQMAPTTSIQGIDEFDGHWANITVTNNVVVTTGYNGILYADVTKLNIANNIVLWDGLNNQRPWIGVSAGKDNGISTNVIVENNISASYLLIPKPDFPMDVLNNASVVGGNFVWDGAPGYYDSTPGPIPFGNQVLALQAPALFKNLTIVNGAVTGFDLHLVPGTPVVGTGTATSAPTTYITGAARTGPTNLGAYPVEP